MHEAIGARAGKRIIIIAADDALLINALQRRAAVVLQKSLREGFGLTVSEAMWKGRAVIGGDVGGIRHQIDHGHSGFLVSDMPRRRIASLSCSAIQGCAEALDVGRESAFGSNFS